MKVVWSAAARDDLMRIKEWVAFERPRAAKDLARRIRDLVRSVATFPMIGRAVGEERRLVVGHYLIFDRIEEAQTLVRRVRDSRQPLPDIVEERIVSAPASRSSPG